MQRPSLATVRHIVAIALMLAIGVPVALIAWRVNSFLTVERLKNLENNLDTTALSGQMTANAYSEVARATVETLDNSVAPGINQIVNRVDSTMAAVERRVNALAPTQTAATKAISGGHTLLVDFNTRLNSEQGLMAAATNLINNLTTTASKFNVTTDELNTAIRLASEKTNKSLDSLYTLIASDHWPKLIENLEGTSAEVRGMAANMNKASAKAPSIAESLEKIAKTSSRFTKITLISNIIATLARAFLP